MNLISIALAISGLSAFAFALTAIRGSETSSLRSLGAQHVLTTKEQLSRMTGNARRPVVVEFGDYFCPYCKQFDLEIQRLHRLNSEKFSLRFNDLPLVRLHPWSMDAARLVRELSNEEGSTEAHNSMMFGDPNERFLANVSILQASDSSVPYMYARVPAYISVLRDVELADELQVKSTPSFFYVAEDDTCYKLPTYPALERFLKWRFSLRSPSEINSNS